ncbi:hypothetical protein J437_LFUL016411 [Ladona fulva]|uniref:Cytochrome P450 n=1 Tax=Ladona fulva TaxID=123851 RepID=A0A8K0KS81_LADFU|nr:hypothetical protein J437_LFUL016411 [Ladona fulva]
MTHNIHLEYNVFCYAGPPWLPIAGCLPYIAWKCREKNQTVNVTFTSLAKEYATQILGIKVGKDRLIVLCSYEAAREVLSREEFDGRPTGVFFDTRTWGIRRGVIVVDGPLWHEQRRFILRHLKDFGFARRSMEDFVQKEVTELIKYFMKSTKGEQNQLTRTPSGGAVSVTVESMDADEMSKKNDGSLVWLHDAFGVSVLNTIWSMMAGVRYDPEDSELRELQAILSSLFVFISASGCAFSHFPLLRYIAPGASGYNQFIGVHQRIWKFIHREIGKHKETYQSGKIRDLMDVYLAQMEEDEREGKENTYFDDDQLVAICMDLFMAGSETTAKSLAFLFLYITTHPEVQKKLHAEIDAVTGGDRMPTLEDRSRMPYTEAVILEGLRLFASKTFGLAHRALSDAWLQGHFIPKDTMILINYESFLCDKEKWTDPEEFRPERFVDASGKVNIPSYYLPFGLGKRRCMGESMAKSNIFLFMTGLLQEYQFSIPEGEAITAQEKLITSGITPGVLPYRARIKIRR